MLIAGLTLSALAFAISLNLPTAERGAGRLALFTGHYELGIQLLTDSLARELARCMRQV